MFNLSWFAAGPLASHNWGRGFGHTRWLLTMEPERKRSGGAEIEKGIDEQRDEKPGIETRDEVVPRQNFAGHGRRNAEDPAADSNQSVVPRPAGGDGVVNESPV